MEAVKIHNRNVEPGTELSIEGERGRFRFLRLVTKETSEWIDVVDKDHKIRSFYPARVRRVHYKKKLR